MSFRDITMNHNDNNDFWNTNSPAEVPSVLSDDNKIDDENDQSTEETEHVPHHVKKVLVQLLKKGVVLFSTHRSSFETVCEYRQLIKQHLAAMFIELVLDEKAGIAFIRNQDLDSEDGESPPYLIRTKNLDLYDTLVLLVLRQYYQERELFGEDQIIIDIETVADRLEPLISEVKNTKTEDSRIKASLKDFKEKQILKPLRGTDLYEITPFIKYIVDATFLAEMLNEYKALAELNNIEMN